MYGIVTSSDFQCFISLWIYKIRFYRCWIKFFCDF